VPRFLAAAACLLALFACTTGSDTTTPSAPTSATVSVAPRLPGGMPPSFGDAVEAANVPSAALIPLRAVVTGTWRTQTAGGEAIVVSWEFPGRDPFRKDRGVAAWRRFDDGGAPWRPVWGASYPARRDPVLGIDTKIADVTGDGSPDALVTASTGGSGDCGTTSVVDLAAGSEVYRDTGCDRTIEPSSDPVGLHIHEAVYAPGDPHCCPSSFRDTVLVDQAGTWQTASTSTSPA
jgi:hypothetical protein